MLPVDYVMHSRSCSAFTKNTDILKELLELYCKYVKDTSTARQNLDKGIRKLFEAHKLEINDPEF
jgi:hypothetical protein